MMISIVHDRDVLLYLDYISPGRTLRGEMSGDKEQPHACCNL